MVTLQRGKYPISPTPEISDIRELAREDLAHLTQPRPARQIQTIRDNHHRIARAIASGLSDAEIRAVCGISQARLGRYRADPAGQELIAHYRSLVTAEWLAREDPVNEFLSSIRTKSLAMIEDKIEAAAEAGEHLPSRDLAVFAELGLDRTGYGKVNKNVNVNLDFAANLERARKASSNARRPAIVEQASPPLAPRSDSVPTRSPPAAAPSPYPQRAQILRRL